MSYHSNLNNTNVCVIMKSVEIDIKDKISFNLKENICR